MTRLRQVFDRLGAPAAMSWPVFWASLAFNGYAAFAGSFTPTASWGDRVLAIVLSQGTMWGFLLLCRSALLASSLTRGRSLVVVGCFLLAGLIRAMTVGVLYDNVLDLETFQLVPRILIGVVFGLVAFVPAALITSTVRDYRATRAALLMSRAQLAATATVLVEEMAASDERATDRIRAGIMEALSEAEASGDPAALDRLASDVVRPLSHELAHSIPAWEPTVTSAARVRIADVLDYTLSGRPLMPVTTMSAVSFTGLLPLWLNAAGRVSVVFGLTAFIAGTLALIAVNRAFPALARGRGRGARLAIVLGPLSAVGFALGALADFLVGPGRLALPWIQAFWLLVVGFGFALALAKGAVEALEGSLAELRETDERLAWQVARLRMVQWIKGQRAARALHGPVQGAIAASAARLRQATDSDTEVIAGLRASLLDALTTPGEGRSFAEGFELVRATWEGLCDVAVVSVADDITRLDADDVVRDIAIDITTEAVSNAVRHGKARHVTVEVTCETDRVLVRVIDDGTSLKASRPGLGTRILSDCTLEWSRAVTPTSTCLEALLPLDG